MTATKRKGRPPRSEQGAASMVLTMRIQPDLYDELRLEAESNSRSIAAQAERRLRYQEPDAGDVGRMLQLVIKSTEAREGKSLRDDAATRTKCRLAADVVLNSLLGPPPPLERVRDLVTVNLKQAKDLATFPVLAQILDWAQPALGVESIQEMIDVLTEAEAVRDNAEETLRKHSERG